MSQLADRLSEARHRLFVGRTAELRLFEGTITAPTLPFSVLYVFGPGGVGKTSLLRECARICVERGRGSVYLDGRNVEPSPESLLAGLAAALGCAPQGSLHDLVAAVRHQAIFIDTYEVLAPLDAWLWDILLPQLPETTLVVIASRNPPNPAWRSDLGWQAVVRTVSLRNLTPDEGRAYLTKREAPSDQHQAVLDFTHGHPLALSLVADLFAQRPNTRFQPAAAPDLVRTLLELFVQKVPGPAHRAALEACALMRVTTEALLAEMLAMPDAHELFEWLRGLSFIESGPLGIFPHDLAREALVADLRWRNPDWYAELHRRARAFYLSQLQTRTQDQQRVLFDYIFLHRDSPVVRPFIEWQESGSGLTEVAREGDYPALLAMVERHEGPESARLAEYWFRRQPSGVVVFRDGEHQPVGFLAMVALRDVSPDDRAADPAVAAAASYLERRVGLRPGEVATLFRFWMARDGYQDVSSIQSLVFVNAVGHYLTTPGLAFHFFPCADPDFWAPLFAYADLARIPEADFEVGGRRYGAYGHDWRVVPPMAWLELLAEREMATGIDTSHVATPPAVVVLSEPEFATAVRAALRDFSRSTEHALRSNPLLRSRLVLERAGVGAAEGERVAALRALVREAAQTLLGNPRDEKLYRALNRTYFEPAPTQEAAAEVLDLPFSTYRRHLKTAVDRLAGVLWQWELKGAAS